MSNEYKTLIIPDVGKVDLAKTINQIHDIFEMLRVCDYSIQYRKGYDTPYTVKVKFRLNFEDFLEGKKNSSTEKTAKEFAQELKDEGFELYTDAEEKNDILNEIISQ